MKTVKRLIGCVITLGLIIGSVFYLGNLVRPTDTDIAISTIETFHTLPENSLEVIGYGSSHMWRGLDVMEMYEKYGIGAYNYGCNWQHINTTALFIKDSLRTQSPKVILIETFNVDSILMNTGINGEIYYTRGISDFEGKREYLKQCFQDDWERYLSYYMPLSAFHENWVNINKISFRDPTKGAGFFDTMGYMSSDAVCPITIGDPSAFNQKELNVYALEILDEVVSICKKQNIEIIFYTAPWQGEYEYGDAMERYAEENGCKYFNMFELVEEVGLDGNTDFSDAGHLNDNGSIKVADYLGKYIIDHYGVTDMRTIANNLWEQYR